jgi:hypothetical protein
MPKTSFEMKIISIETIFILIGIIFISIERFFISIEIILKSIEMNFLSIGTILKSIEMIFISIEIILKSIEVSGIFGSFSLKRACRATHLHPLGSIAILGRRSSDPYVVPPWWTGKV